jgi:lipooligosaccharide transport system permease protein
MSDSPAWLESIRLAALVAWRHWRIFRRDLLANVSPTLVDPFLYVLVFGYWLGSQVPVHRERSYLAFMAPGIAAMAALFTSFFEGSYGFFVRLELEHVFKALLTTPVGPREILLGELVWLGAKGAIMASIVSLVLLALGVVEADYIVLIPLMGCMTGVACGAIGLIASCLVRNINQFQAVYAWIISPMFFTSSMFVPEQLVPRPVQYVCWLSPFYHAVKLSQATLWPERVGETWVIHGAALAALAAALVTWAARRILPRLHL